MMINLLTVSTRPPRWIAEGYQTYATRFPSTMRVQLVDIPPAKRTKSYNADQCKQEEAQALLARLPKSHKVIALDEHGEKWTTQQFAKKLQGWQEHAPTVSFLVGGADGLGSACLERADHTWSLSPLTFPHHLVRIIFIEQLYRAWTLLNHHPYHRV